MIIPVESEGAWRGRLDGLVAFEPPIAPTVVVSPHPDDETLGCGGLIAALTARGIEVSVVAVTDGENAYAGEAGLGEVREREQTQALVRLGVAAERIHRFRLVDSGVKQQAVYTRLLPLVREGMHLVAPWERDFHPDHEECGQAAAAVAALRGCALTSYFFWTWHRGEVALLDGMELKGFALSEGEMRAKAEALACHRSQLEHASGEPILPEYLLGPMQRPYEVFLPR